MDRQDQSTGAKFRMNQNFTLPEIQAALRVAGITPTSASPLADVQPAMDLDRTVMESLRQKGVCGGSQSLSPEWQRTLETLADPSLQATLHVEGIGTASYFGGVGGIAAMVPIEDDQQKILGQLSTDTILMEIDVLMGWIAVPDGPPFQVELSIEELTTVASLADARREEHLRAVIERRKPFPGRISRSDAERQVTLGQHNPDSRWLISILDRFAPQDCRPNAAALEPGTSTLLGRELAKVADGWLELSPDLEILCDGFANVVPFLAIGVGAPSDEQSVALFTRGWQNFWGIEFDSSEGQNSAVVSRLGARAMEEKLRRHLAAFTPPPAQTPGDRAPAAEAGSGWKSSEQPTDSDRADVCPRCGALRKPDKKFCVGCGYKFSPLPQAEQKVSEERRCPNPECARLVPINKKFCSACGTRIDVGND